MSKKQLLLFAFMVIANAVFMSSCSSDDDDSSGNNLPEKAKQFVGFWADSKNGLFAFYGDGTACLFGNDIVGNEYLYGPFSGNWTYNETTGILATDIHGWQWQVTLTTANTWTGIKLGNAASISYTRLAAISVLYMLIDNGEWRDGNKTFYPYEGGYNGSVFPSPTSNYSFKGFTLSFSTKEGGNDEWTFDYEVKERHSNMYSGYTTKSLGTGTVQVVEPYYPSKTQLIFSGPINAKLKKTSGK